jgi:hypothetical protein
MNSSEFGNVSWVYYVVGAYAVVVLSLAAMTLSSLRRFRIARRALKEEGFSDDKV